jgi:hypothetical protein
MESYADKYPVFVMTTILRNFRDGDKREVIESAFSEVGKPSESGMDFVQEIWSHRGWVIEPSDEIVQCRMKNRQGSAFLQFREGRLVNFAHEDYADPVEHCRINNCPIPPWANENRP